MTGRRPRRPPAGPASRPYERPLSRYADSVPFALERVQEKGVCVVAVQGDLDIVTSLGFAAGLEDAPSRTVLDLSGCRFVDSTGLRVILELARRLGDGLAIARTPGSSPARVFELAGIDQLRLYDDRRDAVRALR